GRRCTRSPGRAAPCLPRPARSPRSPSTRTAPGSPATGTSGPTHRRFGAPSGRALPDTVRVPPSGLSGSSWVAEAWLPVLEAGGSFPSTQRGRRRAALDETAIFWAGRLPAGGETGIATPDIPARRGAASPP